MPKQLHPLPIPQSNEQVYAHAIATELRRLNDLLARLVPSADKTTDSDPEPSTASHRDVMRFRP